jgi:hypothetical protein
MLGILRLAEELVVSQEGFCCMGLVCYDGEMLGLNFGDHAVCGFLQYPHTDSVYERGRSWYKLPGPDCFEYTRKCDLSEVFDFFTYRKAHKSPLM